MEAKEDALLALRFSIRESAFADRLISFPSILISPPLLSFCDLENNLQLDRCAERKACHTIDQPAWILVFSEDVLQQLRSGISDFWLIAHVSRSGDGHTEADDSRHFVERSQVFSRDSKNVERGEMCSLASRFHVKLLADAPYKFCHTPFRGEHPGQKKQIARLHRLHISTERFRRRRELDAKFFQPLLGAGWLRAFAVYHLPMCAPPSTCSTSPVIWRASVR